MSGAGRSLVAVLVLSIQGPGASAGQSVGVLGARPGETPDAAQILELALERARWAEEQGFERHYRYEVMRRVQRYHGDGRLRQEEVREFEVEPIEGVPFSRLVAREGLPLSTEEAAVERERERQFTEDLANGLLDAELEENEDEVVFNKELVARYVFELEGMEQLRNRTAYRLSFSPREGRLPVRRRIDRALNHARGNLWIDKATSEVGRVEFELIDQVRIGWGVIGKLSQARGSFDRYPFDEDIWAPLQLETFFHSRVLFSSTRRAELDRWRGFALVEAGVPSNGP